MLICQENGSIRWWNVVNCCNFFALATSQISTVDSYQNLHDTDSNNKIRHWSTDLLSNEADFQQSKFFVDLTDSYDGNTISSSEDKFASAKKMLSEKLILKEALISYSSQDLRVVSSKGSVIARFEPEAVIEGIKSFTMSLYQDMLFCLMDSETTLIKVYDTSKLKCPLLKSKHIRTSDQDTVTCINLINVVPSSSIKAKQVNQRPNNAYDCRGNLSPSDLEEVLVVGMSSGMLLFLDSFNDFEIILMFQAQIGPVSKTILINKY